jgi:transcriptional regulator with XRE-family HTH domain
MTPKTTSQREQEERVRVGATLRTIRTTRGWDLGPLATHVGISYSYLSNIEAGRKPLTDILLARLAAALDVEQIAIKVPTGKAAKSSSSEEVA